METFIDCLLSSLKCNPLEDLPTGGQSAIVIKGTCARNYRPCFRENQPKRSFSIKWKRAFWACFRENWVYIFGHWQWGGFSGVLAEIGSSWVPYTTFRAIPILASNSRRYSYSKNDSLLSPIRGVADSLYRWYGESPTPCIVELRSRRLPASLIRGVSDSPHHRYRESAIEFFLKKTLCIDDTESRRLPAPVIRWVAHSPYCWVGESPTPLITDTESRRLLVPLSRQLHVSVIRGVAIRKKICLASIFSTLNG